IRATGQLEAEGRYRNIQTLPRTEYPFDICSFLKQGKFHKIRILNIDLRQRCHLVESLDLYSPLEYLLQRHGDILLQSWKENITENICTQRPARKCSHMDHCGVAILSQQDQARYCA